MLVISKQMHLEGLSNPLPTVQVSCVGPPRSCDIGAKKFRLWLPTNFQFVMALAPVNTTTASQGSKGSSSQLLEDVPCPQ